MDSKDQPTLQGKMRQGCFICLEDGKQGHVVFWVPLDRPHVHLPTVNADSKDRTDLGNNPEQPPGERDSDIWRKLVSICNQSEKGNWKRYIPGYGISAVHEVTFRITGPKNENGSYPAAVSRADIAPIMRECSEAMEKPVDDDSSPYDCLKKRLAECTKRKDRILGRFWLTETALDPSIADKRPTLDGFEQETCLYESSEIVELMSGEEASQVSIRGLLFTKGLATRQAMICVSYAWLAFAVQHLYQCKSTPEQSRESLLPEASARLISAALGALLWIRDSRKRAVAATNRQPGEALFPLNQTKCQPRHQIILITYLHCLIAGILDVLLGVRETGSALRGLVELAAALIGLHAWDINNDACKEYRESFPDHKIHSSLPGGDRCDSLPFFRHLLFYSAHVQVAMCSTNWWIHVFSGSFEWNHLDRFPWKLVGLAIIAHRMYGWKREAKCSIR